MLAQRAFTCDDRYSNATDLSEQAQCLLCPPGTACSTGSVAPLPCAPGSMQAEEERSSCDYCPPGYFQNVTSSTTCLPCPGGTYAGISGLAECNRCLARLSSHEASTSCTLCAEGFFRLDVKTVATPQSCDNSLCDGPGVYCPEDSTLETLVLLPGYWRLSNRSREITSCSGGNVSVRCTGGTGASAAGTRRRLLRRALHEEASLTAEGDVYCGELYTGPE